MRDSGCSSPLRRHSSKSCFVLLSGMRRVFIFARGVEFAAYRFVWCGHCLGESRRAIWAAAVTYLWYVRIR